MFTKTINNIQLLNKYVEEGYISKRKHPHFNLYIYNYTLKTQSEGFWNNVTRSCRGLVLDEEYEIVARPFSKFFNYGEPQNSDFFYKLRNQKYSIYEKYDGSLGILFNYKDLWITATRGSFESDQAQKMTEILNNLVESGKVNLDNLNKELTYLFEIIYPENRIVKNYSDLTDIILIGIIHTKSGKDYALNYYENIPFENILNFTTASDLTYTTDIKKKITEALKFGDKNFVKTFESLMVLNKNFDDEGFIFLFDDGSRVKFKYTDYVKMAYFIHHSTNMTIWEALKADIYLLNTDLRDPYRGAQLTEHREWVFQIITEIKEEMVSILKKSFLIYKEISKNTNLRKDFAFAVLKNFPEYSEILFKIYDKIHNNKDYNLDKILINYAKPKIIIKPIINEK